MGPRGRGRGGGDGGHRGPRPIAKLADGGTFLVGLASEVNAGNKARKAGNEAAKAEQQQQGASGAFHSGQTSQFEEARPLPRPAFSLELPITTPLYPLPYPVILPQRRPNNKSRGFIHAYPPDLGSYKGIDEIAFLQFLAEFHKSSQASPVFTAINVAAMVAGFTPGLIAFAVSNSVAMASQAGAEYHSRYRTNSYLDKANEQFFHPRNLHCMIMTFKPGEENAMVDIDGRSGATSGVQTSGLLSKLSLKAKSLVGGDKPKTEGNFRTSDGITQGELKLPRAAELVYPDPKMLASLADGSSSDDEESQKPRKQPSAWKTMSNSAAQYIDRRAQAEYAMEHGTDSRLAMPGATDSSQFASKYSDPSYVNPVTSGLNNLSLRGSDRGRGRGGRGGRDHGHGSISRESSPDPISSDPTHQANTSKLHKKKGVGPILGTLLAEDVLYLLIAEIPSREELDVLLKEAA